MTDSSNRSRSLIEKLSIAGSGMITPVGADTRMTLAAVNAGINRYQASSFINKQGNPMTIARVPSDALPPLDDALKPAGLTSRERKLVRLSAPAILEALSRYPLEQPLPLFLAGPEPLPNSTPVTARLIRLIALQTKANIDIERSRYFASGRAGLIEAIELAHRYMVDTGAPYILVGGVESYMDARVLRFLDADERVLAEGISDAFAPSEGAGFLLLSQKGYRYQERSIGLHRPGLAIEENGIYGNEPCLGDGLSKAFGLAIAGGMNKRISAIFSGVNGEQFYAKEWGVATLRHSESLIDGYKHEHPADCCGDMGAAAGVLLILAGAEQLCQSEEGASILLCLSSDFRNRGAICMSVSD